MTGIKRIDHVALCVEPERWSYESENRAKIDKHWKKMQAENSTLHNGEVFMLTEWATEDNRLEGVVRPASYASFLYWREQGYPETGARNCFGSSILQSREGHILYGRMAANTSTAGLVYPVGGSFGEEDVRDGMLLVERNIARELEEETGLKPQDARREAGYICVEEGPRMSLAAKFVFDCDARELSRRICSHLETCDVPELDEVVIFRRRAFARHHRMPPFARMLIEHLLQE